MYSHIGAGPQIGGEQRPHGLVVARDDGLHRVVRDALEAGRDGDAADAAEAWCRDGDIYLFI